MAKRHIFATVALVVAAISSFAAPAGAHGNHGDNHREDRHHENEDHHEHHRDHHGDIRIVADHLNNPRQIAVHDGAEYVAEAGTGGDICPPDAGGACVGFTGSGDA